MTLGGAIGQQLFTCRDGWWLRLLERWSPQFRSAGSAAIEDFFNGFYSARGLVFEPTPFDGRSDYGPFIAPGVDIPAGGLFTGAEGIKMAAEVAVYGRTAGQQYDPCYHAACDTFTNNNDTVLDLNSDAIAAATLTYAMSTQTINGIRGKGNFKVRAQPSAGDGSPLTRPSRWVRSAELAAPTTRQAWMVDRRSTPRSAAQKFSTAHLQIGRTERSALPADRPASAPCRPAARRSYRAGGTQMPRSCIVRIWRSVTSALYSACV